MERAIVVKSVDELDALEQKIRNGTRGLAIALGFMSKRCLDNWDGEEEEENLLRFLYELSEGEVGQDPLNDEEKISLERQASLTFRYIAAIGAIRWLYRAHPEIRSYAFNVDDGVDDTGFHILSGSDINRVVAMVTWCLDRAQAMQTKRAALDLDRLNRAKGFTGKYMFVMSQNERGDDYVSVGKHGGITIMARGVEALNRTNN